MLKLDKIVPPPHLRNGDHISQTEFRELIGGKKKSTVRASGPKLRRNYRQDFAELKNGILRIAIHELPPSQNRWKTWHHMVLAEETKRWNEIITLLGKGTGAKFIRPVVRFMFYWPDNRNYDTKNFASWKPLLDGLTRAGVIRDDNYKELQEEEPGTGIDRENPRVEILVREI